MAGTQERLVAALARRSRGTWIGRRLGLRRVGSLASLAGTVPLSTWADYEEPVARIAAGEPRVLTAEPVLRLVPTSGTTDVAAGSKLVPCTRSLFRAFARALDAWVVDLVRTVPAVTSGPGYWALSPAVAPRPGTSAVPVGFAEDEEYLGRVARRAAPRLLAVPPAVRRAPDVGSFLYLTLLFLLRARDLALVSVWHPSLLLLLLEALPRLGASLAADIASGTLSPATPLSPGLRDDLALWVAPDRARGAEVERALGHGTGPDVAARLWPRLALLSCWADGPAAAWTGALSRAFPSARLQGKGLLSTEGVVSVPIGDGDPVLAVRSHVVELLDGAGVVRAAHEAARGGPYEVVLTTQGGLWRYRTGDLVAVTGHLAEAPRLRFLGRAGDVSDRFGEKLSEAFVAEALRRALCEVGLAAAPAVVAFEEATGGYALFVEAPAADGERIAAAASRLERILGENVHYAWARGLGQLRPLMAFRIEAGLVPGLFALRGREGGRLGDVKLPALFREGGLLGRIAASPVSGNPVSVSSGR